MNATALDEWMAVEVPGSPLVGLGQVFVAEGVRHGIDPRALVAIARHESVLGTQGSGAGINNAFGTGHRLPLLEENIATVARGLAHNYIGKGRATLADIQPIWAPVRALNDPGDLNSAWVDAVGRYYADLGGDPDRPITLEAQGGVFAADATIGPSGLATPTGGTGTLGGGPGEGTHSYTAWPNNWQSDHAVDILLRFGSPLYAVDAGEIVRIGGDPTDFSGRFGGARLTVVWPTMPTTTPTCRASSCGRGSAWPSGSSSASPGRPTAPTISTSACCAASVGARRARLGGGGMLPQSADGGTGSGAVRIAVELSVDVAYRGPNRGLHARRGAQPRARIAVSDHR